MNIENSITVKTCLLVIDTDRQISESTEKFRGFISKNFSEYPIFHNHINGELIYSYPRIQYKIIDGKAYILGLDEGAKLIKMVSEIDKLYLGDKIYNIQQKTFIDKEEKIGPTKELIQYKFVSIWLGLSQKNYPLYKTIKEWKERKVLLNGIIRGNIITLSKGLCFDVEPDIYVHSKLKEIKTRFKVDRIGFIGEFRTNFKIPDLFGLGKSASTGFGVVKHENSIIAQ